MLPGQTSPKITTISHQVTVFAQQTQLEGSARKDFSALWDPMNLLLAQEGIIVKGRVRTVSLLSATQAGFVQVVLMCRGHQME